MNRRKFIQSASAATLIACKPDLASAWIRGSATTAPTGKALINGPSDDQSFPWANVLKTASFNGPTLSATYPFPAYLDSNGYPNNAPSNVLGDNLQYFFSIPAAWGTAPLYAGFSGTGAFYMQPAAVSNYTVVSGTVTLDETSLPTFIKISGTDLKLAFNFTTAPISTQDGYIGYFVTGKTYSNMSNMYLCRQSDFAALQANPNALNPDYVSVMKALNPRTFRGLDISGVNTGNQSQFSQRPPAGAFSFFFERYPPECWSGSASGTDIYTCSTPSGWAGLVDGATVIIQFTNANTLTGASVTLNVGSTGAHQITTLDPNNLNAGSIAAGSIWTLTYSSVYGYWTGYNNVVGPASSNIGGIVTRAPLEQHIAIANAINANLWYNIGHRMSPADGTSIASTVLANLNSQLAFYPELSNEIWNLKSATTFVYNLGVVMGLGTAFGAGGLNAYGLLVRRMMGAITTAWGGVNSRLRRVMAFQAVSDPGPSGGNNLWRFQGQNLAPSGTGQGGLGLGNAIYNSFTGSADYTTFPNRPIDFSDVLSYATYYGGGQLQQFDANYTSTQNSKNITGITKDATGGVLSYGSDPGYSTGYRVNIASVVGMTQINGANVTLSKLTATTYKMFTDATLGTGFDTSGFTAYSSGGTSSQYPIISGLTAWSDLFVGGGSGIATAFNDLDADIRSGSQYNNSGVLSQNGTQTLLDLNTNTYPGWETLAASYDGAGRPSGTVNLTIECYEGGFGGLPPNTADCTILGIATTYAAGIQNLMFAYKNDARFSTLVQNQYAQFIASGTHAKTPAWFQIIGFGGPWALTPGDLYTLPPLGSGEYQSWIGTVAFNH